MKAIPILAVALATALLPMRALLAQRGVSEINEGTVRRTYVDRPLVGARGYVVGDWEQGQVRVEVVNFPTSETGYEAFLFEIDIPAYMSIMFVDGDPQQGIVSNPPPFDDVAGLISQWYSLGDVAMDEHGNGTLAYREGEGLAARGLNMIMVFEKVTAGRHEGPDDFVRLMVECNGPLTGTPGSEGMARAIKIFP